MASGSVTNYSSDFYAVQEFRKNNQTISSKAKKIITFDVTKSGYTPIGVLGAGTASGTTNGKNVTWCGFTNVYVWSAIDTQVGIRNNHASEDAIIDVFITILYKKN